MRRIVVLHSWSGDNHPPDRERQAATTHHLGQTMQPIVDFAGLDDPQFLAARARLRRELEDLPESHADRAELQRTYDSMTPEFDRRASRSWCQKGKDNGR